jgi:hypothetical protein
MIYWLRSVERRLPGGREIEPKAGFELALLDHRRGVVRRTADPSSDFVDAQKLDSPSTFARRPRPCFARDSARDDNGTGRLNVRMVWSKRRPF